MTRSDKKLIKDWIEALRSGEYKQGYQILDGPNGYCCLGVLCRLIQPRTDLSQSCFPNEAPGAYPEIVIHADDIFSDLVAYSDRADTSDNSLAMLNDSREYNFDEIADLIQLVFIERILD